MIQIGLITTLYDHLAFPNPPEMVDLYKETNDDTGKEVMIPHPVKGLRIWDHENKTYQDFHGRLEGAPEPDNEKEYWDKMIAKLTERFPEEMERIQARLAEES